MPNCKRKYLILWIKFKSNQTLFKWQVHAIVDSWGAFLFISFQNLFMTSIESSSSVFLLMPTPGLLKNCEKLMSNESSGANSLKRSFILNCWGLRVEREPDENISLIFVTIQVQSQKSKVWGLGVTLFSCVSTLK